MSEAAERRFRGRIGTTIRGKYRVEAYLNTGSMASVYSARHRNGSRVALKILHPNLSRDPTLVERFKREGYYANAVEHPGVVHAIDDDFTEDGCAFLVLELLEGETLEEKRKRAGGKLPVLDVLDYADRLLDVLGAAHDRGIIHRDLKPENLFITTGGVLKVLDFGVARMDDGKASSDVTGSGMVLGTPAFMPPEQALGHRDKVDARSDIWAVGATLFNLISGEAVHTGDDARAKLIATARKPARSLETVAPEAPRQVVNAIDRALAYDRGDRWDDVGAMREALRWARMALENAFEFDPKTIRDPAVGVPAPMTTRRRRDDEPTAVRMSPFATRDGGDDVFTSAPPISSQKDIPVSVAAPVSSDATIPAVSVAEGPAPESVPVSFGLPESEAFSVPESALAPRSDLARSVATNEPAASSDLVFSLRREKDGPSRDEPPPATTRLTDTPRGGLAATFPMPSGPLAPGPSGASVTGAPQAVPSAPPYAAPHAPPSGGSLRAQVEPSRSSPLRVLVPTLLVVAALVGGGYVLARRRGLTARPDVTADPSAATATPSASASPSASPSALVPPASAPPVTEAPPPSAATEAPPPSAATEAPPAAATTAAPARPSPAPRPRPAAATTTEAPKPAPSASAAPDPTPTAAPTAPAPTQDPPAPAPSATAPKGLDLDPSM